MSNCLTHFEIYDDQPARLAEFYRTLFGWEIEQMPGIDYWRIEAGFAENSAHGWKYNATTGATLNVPDYGVSSYPVKVVDGKILVAVS